MSPARLAAGAALLIALAAPLAIPGCKGEEKPEDPPPAAAAPPPAPADPAPAPAAPVVWSTSNIQDLHPVRPTREGRFSPPLAPDPAYDVTIERLKKVVDGYAGDPENPWAIAHGILAVGPDFKLTNGQPAVEWVFAQYAEEFDAGGVKLVRFPPARGSVRIEPHADLLLKNLTELNVDPARPVTVAGNPHTVADLYRGSLLRAYLDPFKNHSSFSSTDDISWATQGLAAWAPPNLTWIALDGTAMNLNDLASFNVAVLDQETKFLADAMAAGAGFKREGQPLFQYTCGGAHLLQGASYAVARGFGGPKAAEFLAKQPAVWYYRLPRELAQYDEVAQRTGEKYRLKLLVQRLKFTGHFLESLTKMAAMGQHAPDDAQRKLLTGAAQQVAVTVEALHQLGALDAAGLAKIRAEDEQVYLDIVGDSSHALRGLELALGKGAIWY